jgi:hypothetical protein
MLREPDLPVASHDEVSRECKLLVDRREDLVGQRTATVNRLVWRIHELDPARSPGILNYPKYRNALREWLAGQSGIVAELALQELADITRLTKDINALENRITDRVREVAPRLYGMLGCGAVTAAKIMGETALVTRFSCEAAFAQHAGLARFRTGPDAAPDGCVDRNTVIGNLIRRFIASPSPSFGWTARGGTIATNDLRLATPDPWHFGHSNDGSAVRSTATCARIIDAANAAIGSPANSRQVEEPAALRSVAGQPGLPKAVSLMPPAPISGRDRGRDRAASQI